MHASEVLLEKLSEQVDEFAERVGARDDVVCKSGCDACCQVELSVCRLEAERVSRAARAMAPALRAQLGRGPGCAFLVESRCTIYRARPLVCRSQGLPLAYEAGTVPAESLSARASDGRDLTWCPLNFRSDPPRRADVLDAERVDVTLASLNRAFCEDHDLDALERVSLRTLAGEC